MCSPKTKKVLVNFSRDHTFLLINRIWAKMSSEEGSSSSAEGVGDAYDSVGTSEDDSSGKSQLNLQEYDESNYPADAESEGDDEGHSSGGEDLHFEPRSSSGEGLVVEEREPALSDDSLCAVCAEVFIEPCTLHCGHSFCQLCLAALWKSSRKRSPHSLSCPVCRQPWVNFPGINIQLRYFCTPIAFVESLSLPTHVYLALSL